ncbi:hypothetical protein [Amycolatopsis sp. 195334CR]|uniref:hypothetical protein n=1 Tax=Amycolatopsis sp. 195334CR TaxID=2814588 RepID=UPI001A8FC37D|nr:hypothetical protein [Amycolatopsis sp. 195334CR]MBN6037195.1 hypothetical protein [Amycolatopsis sp. 195334CR]
MAGEYDGATYESEVYDRTYRQAGGGEGNIFAEFSARSEAEAVASAYSVTRGQVLMEGQDFRPGLDTSDQEYLGTSHDELYNMVHTENDPAAVDEQGKIFRDLAGLLNSVAADAAAASNAEEANWQGPAAAKAHGFVKSTGQWLDGTAQGADLASNRYSQQSAAAMNAQNSMPEPVPFNQAEEMAKAQQAFQSGGFDANMQGVKALEEMSAKQEASQAAHQQAAQVMHTMDNTLYETGSTQPSFAAPPTLGGGQPSTPVAGTGAGPVTSAPGGPTGGMPGGMPGGGYVGSGPGSAPGYTPGGPAPVTSNAPAGGGFKGTPPAIAGQVGGGNLGNLGADKNRAPKPTTGMKFGNPSAGARVSGGGTYSPPKGPAGAAGRLGGTPAGGVPKGAEQAAGAGKSSGSGGPPPKEGTMRGGAAAAASTAGGKPGAGMGGAPAGAGRGKEEDKDKKRPDYLQGEDPDELFDAKPAEGLDGAKPVPPVIGS